MSVAEQEQVQSSAVERLLLQQHENLLRMRNMLAVSNRGLFLLIVGLLTFKDSSPSMQSVGLALGSVVLAAIWGIERRWIGLRLDEVGRGLARTVGGRMEDVYIQSWVHRSFPAPFEFIVGIEPILWFVVVLIHILLSAVFPKTGI